MITLIRRICTTLVAATVVIGCADNADDDTTNLRFFNAVVGFDSVDVLVDSDEYLEEIAYLESTAYLEFDTQPHLLQITPSNSLTPIDSQRVSLQDDVDYTYIACGNSTEPEAILLEDDTEPAGDATFKARIINVFRGVRGFDVYVTQNADDIGTLQPTASGLRYKAATRYRAGSAGVYDIVVRNSATGALVARLAGQNFEGENVYSIMLVPAPEQPAQVRVLVLTDRDINS